MPVDHLAEEECAFVAAVDAWVEFGLVKPTGRLWDVVVKNGDSYIMYLYGNKPEFEAMRHPRAVLARLSSEVPLEVRVAVTQSLGKFLSDPAQVFECVAYVAQNVRNPMDLLPKFMAPELPELVREYARQVHVGLANPTIFPHVFPEGFRGYHFHGPRYGFLLHHDFAGPIFPFESWQVELTTEEHLASPMFQIESREVQERLFAWVLHQDKLGRAMRMHDVTAGLPYCKLLRRVLESALRTGVRTAAELAVDVACAQNIVRFLMKSPPGAAETELGEIVKQTMRRAEVTPASLDEGVRKLLLSNSSYIHTGVLAMMRLLLSSGASTLLRDEAGFLLVTNVRAGVIYTKAEAELSQRRFFAYHHFPARVQQGDMGQKLHFQNTDIQRDLVDMICEFGANWTRANHHLFPQEFRQRVFTFLMINRRQRTAKVPWLPRDPLEIIFKMVATSDYCDDAQQLLETKALLARTYAPFSDGELRASCRAADTRRGQRFYHHVHGADIVDKPFKRYCEKRGVSLTRKKGVTREFFIDFLVAQELGLLDDIQGMPDAPPPPPTAE